MAADDPRPRPPDEHSWVEQFEITASSRALRTGVRQYNRDHYPLTDAARADLTLNPGNRNVSRLCHEPRVSLAVMEAMLAPYAAGGKLTLLHRRRGRRRHRRAVTLRHCNTGNLVSCSARYIIDATELGNLLPLTATEYVTGFEAQSETGEPSAPAEAQAGIISRPSRSASPSIRLTAIMSSTNPPGTTTGVRSPPKFWPPL
ncbi:FAD-dependent oxidoreductase [Agrobacterium burrii]